MSWADDGPNDTNHNVVVIINNDAKVAMQRAGWLTDERFFVRVAGASEKNLHRVTIPPAVYDRVDAAAKQWNVTFSEAIVMIINQEK